MKIKRTPFKAVLFTPKADITADMTEVGFVPATDITLVAARAARTRRHATRVALALVPDRP